MDESEGRSTVPPDPRQADLSFGAYLHAWRNQRVLRWRLCSAAIGLAAAWVKGGEFFAAVLLALFVASFLILYLVWRRNPRYRQRFTAFP